MSDSPNFLTYAQTAFDPFEERPFCAVDSLVFAWLSYLDRVPNVGVRGRFPVRRKQEAVIA